ncbi:MAG: thioesterase II family protein [Pyrinomonadaceae bacterium]
MNDATADSLWFAKARTDERARIRLFCFPYAGGSAVTFRGWPALLAPEVEVYAVQLPGRWPRSHEPPYDDARSLVGALLPVMERHIDRPFALFGHSMGGAIAFELARRLRGEFGVEPLHLFVSGRRAPHMGYAGPTIYDLPEPEFKEALRRLGGTPAEVLEHPELMELLVPLLRADIALSQTYRCESRPSLTCPLTVFGGLKDGHDEPEVLAAWREHTVGAFDMKMFEGDHFFINTEQRPLLVALERALLGRRREESGW